jgi:hypothetical protein
MIVFTSYGEGHMAEFISKCVLELRRRGHCATILAWTEQAVRLHRKHGVEAFYMLNAWRYSRAKESIEKIIALTWRWTTLNETMLTSDRMQFLEQRAIQAYRACQWFNDAFDPDCRVIWNNLNFAGRSLDIIGSGRTLYLERGWLPKTVILDHLGVNANCSAGLGHRLSPVPISDATWDWVLKTITSYFMDRKSAWGQPKEKLNAADLGDYDLFCGQVAMDTQITQQSCWKYRYDLVYELLAEIYGKCDRKLFIKPHPIDTFYEAHDKAKTVPNATVLKQGEGNIHDWIKNARTVLTVNSTTGFEAMLYGKMVINLGGDAFYHNVGMVTPDVDSTVKILPTIDRYYADTSSDAIGILAQARERKIILTTSDEDISNACSKIAARDNANRHVDIDLVAKALNQEV